MGGFNYGGGKGDGTGWSSERGDGTTPGGGSHGTGGRDSSSSGNSKGAAINRQVNAIKSDPKVQSVLKELQKKVLRVAPYAKVYLSGVDDAGRVQVSVDDLKSTDETAVRDAIKSVSQVKNLLGMGFPNQGGFGFAGNIDTGHGIGNYQSVPKGNNAGNNSAAEDKASLAVYSQVLNGKIPPGFWLDNNKVMTEVTVKYEISGGGKGNDRTGYRKSNVEVPSLTRAYKQWQQVKTEVAQEAAKRKAEQEAKAKADAEAKRKAEEAKAKADAEAKRKAAEVEAKRRAEEEAKRKQAEWDAQNNEKALQQKIKDTQSKIDATQKNIAQGVQQRSQLESQLPALVSERDRLIKLSKQGSKSAQAEARNDLEDAANRVNQLNGNIEKANAAVLQAQQQLAQYQKEKADAEARLNQAQAERKAREEAKKAKDEKEALTKASEIIVDMGEKIGEHLGDKYKSVAKEIADDIKNFQGKTLRSHEQAMASLKKMLDNPGMKINKGDKDTIVNAWKSFKADDTAKKLTNLSKAFAVAGVALKIEKVREKSIEGYETGNWAPLILEVESWVLGGIAASVALGIFSATLGAFALSLGAPAVAVGIVGIIVAGTVAALIDDKAVDFLNNQVIRPAH